MGLFKKKVSPSPEEQAFMEENKKRLETFEATKALGVKKYRVSTQFIYDKEGKCFVVVEGPEETFKEKNPIIADFDQVEEVILDIDEYWSESKDEFAPRGFGRLLQEDYTKVYWRYDFYITIKTTHPYAKDIKFKTNFKPTIMKIKSKNLIFVRRGFEIGGSYTSDELPELIEKMEQLLVDETKQIHGEKVFDIITNNRPDSIVDQLVGEGLDSVYLKKIDNMTRHIKRANKIAKIVLP